MISRWSWQAFLAIPALLGIYQEPAKASCSYVNNEDEICIIRVTASRKTPHLNTAYITHNGKPLTVRVDCSDFTMYTGSEWVKFEVDSPIHEVCSKWSF